MCSVFNPDCGYDKTVINNIEDVYCPNTKCLGELCLDKKTFHSPGRSDNQGSQCASLCQVRKLPFEDQTNSIFCRLSIVSTERNANLLVVMKQLRDPFTVVTIVEPGYLFTKFLLCHKSM